MRHDEFEERRARRVRRARESSALPSVPVSWAPVAGGILLLITVVLTASQWELVAGTTTGRGNSYRDGALAVLIGLGGLRLLVAPGRHRITTAIIVLAGAVLVLGGLLTAHDHPGLAVVEVGSGVLAALCALAAVARPAPGPPAVPVDPGGPGGTGRRGGRDR